MIKLDFSGFKRGQIAEQSKEETERFNRVFHSGNRSANAMLGWVNLPSSFRDDMLADITATAARLRRIADVVAVIGIGGSYMGAKAAIEALGDSFGYLSKDRKGPHIVFAGNNLSEDYMSELLDTLKDYSIAAIVISKSGSTIEPAVAFRFIRSEIEKRYGKNGAKERIVAITDKNNSVLRDIAVREGYDMFHIPGDVGGRYSVLTPVGLLPMSVAGIDIERLMEGAKEMELALGPDTPFDRNPALQYALARNIAYKEGLFIEALANYNPKLTYFGEWWQQLFGESEGKDGKGIFPVNLNFTTDLHSLGQYIQQGNKVVFETVVSIDRPSRELTVRHEGDDFDGLNFLAGKRLDSINKMAELGTSYAHVKEGGVPNIIIRIPDLSPRTLGGLFYFFELACAVSGSLLGVNPFDQPGVEAYKKYMFALLDKPGYEELSKSLDIGREEPHPTGKL